MNTKWYERVALRYAGMVFAAAVATAKNENDYEEAMYEASVALIEARERLKAKREERFKRSVQRELRDTMYCLRWQ
jgi:hypothetical protein